MDAMAEKDAIDAMGAPNTINSLSRDLGTLGVEPGMTLLAHSSLSAIGWVCGGPVAVILALENLLTPEGTLVMPAHSGDISDPAHWGDPPVPEAWWPAIRAEMPPFDPSLTPTRGMGAIPEAFRNQSGVVRSPHHSASFAAWGKHKDLIVQDDHPDFCQNDQSPLGRLYELDGYVLLLGVGYDRNTSLHLAEYRAAYPGKTTVHDGFPSADGGERTWRETQDILYRPEDFPEIGAAFERGPGARIGFIGRAPARLMRQRDLVDFAKAWMEANRRGGAEEES
jgi:aminoglycoside 3-N-acetyltransferase